MSAMCGNEISSTDEQEQDVTLPLSKKFIAYGTTECTRKPLLIDLYEDQILKKLEVHNVLIICGPTGSGKSTRIVQMIHDHCETRRKNCNIIVSEPRRIAAISLAHRVASECGWEMGSIVGYQVALEKQMEKKKTCILYCTTRVLLQKIIEAKSLDQFSHIVLDEIHERSQDLDLLLVIIKRLLNSDSKFTKVILMSATMNMRKFSQYFTYTYNKVNFPAVTLKIDSDFESRRSGNLPSLHIYYLDQIPVDDKPDMTLCRPQLHKILFNTVVKLLGAFDILDKREDERGAKGSVLIFLPGIQEITALYDILREAEIVDWWLLVLHSSITRTEQMKVFTDMNDKEYFGTRKIILSTNIAESSITVPEVKYVIDFCLTKESVYDMGSNHTTLKLNWISKMSAVQRAGRAGRVINGRVYRMVTQSFYDQLPSELEPQILRSPVDKLILDLKLLNMDNPKLILESALDPPKLSNIKNAVSSLKEIGALSTTANGKMDAYDGDLTYLGKIIAKLPLNPRLGKLIVMGRMFNVLDEAKAIACALSVGDIFINTFPKSLEIYSSRLKWSVGTRSDFVTLYRAYTKWQQLVSRGRISKKEEEKYSKQLFVQLNRLREVFNLEKDVDNRLLDLGFQLSDPLGDFDVATKKFFLQVAIGATFYPNYFYGLPNEDDDKIKGGIVKSGFSLESTVYMRGMKAEQPGKMYLDHIVKYFKDITQTINVKFSDSYVYVQLDPNAAITWNKIPDAIYNAVKLRIDNKTKLEIPFLRTEDAERYIVEYKNKKRVSCGKTNGYYGDDGRVQFKVTHCDDEGRFWVQSMDDEKRELSKQLYDDLYETLNLPYPAVIRVGSIYVTIYGRMGRRCRVLKEKSNDTFEVYYVDYGSKAIVSRDSLYEIPEYCLSAHCEDMATECRFLGIKVNRDYADEVQDWIIEACDSNKVISAQIYSNVDDVLTLKVFLSHSTDKTLNNLLVEKGYAGLMEEDYFSKKSHRLLLDEIIDDDIPTPEPEKCKEMVTLEGPYSPLEIEFLSSRLHSLFDKQIFINTNSVNSVLLHDQPDKCHESFVIAASVSVNDSGTVTIKDTVAMPNINGLDCIFSLLFAPVCELKMNSKLTRYTGALCGLGLNSRDGSAVHPSSDISMEFDYKIELDTIDKVNEVRRLMNKMFENFDINDYDKCVTLQSQLLSLVKEILNEERSCLYPEGRHTEHPIQYKWSTNSMNCYKFSEKGDIYKEIIMPLLLKELPNDPFIDCHKIKHNLEFLRTYSGDYRGRYPKKFSCILCNLRLPNIDKVRSHLRCMSHQKAVLKFDKYCSGD